MGRYRSNRKNLSSGRKMAGAAGMLNWIGICLALMVGNESRDRLQLLQFARR